MRYLFVGCLDHDTRKSELEWLFSRFGELDRVVMKIGYAFVYFKDEGHAENALHSLNKTCFGVANRRLNVEWANDDQALKPKRTLFVANFDQIKTKEEHIKKHFEPYGKILNVRIRGKHSFVEFATQKDATKAFEATQENSEIFGRVITVKYAFRENKEGDQGRSFNNGRLSMLETNNEPLNTHSFNNGGLSIVGTNSEPLNTHSFNNGRLSILETNSEPLNTHSFNNGGLLMLGTNSEPLNTHSFNNGGLSMLGTNSELLNTHSFNNGRKAEYRCGGLILHCLLHCLIFYVMLIVTIKCLFNNQYQDL